MGTIKALLIGVCEYPTLGCSSLPLCKNDLYALKSALTNGLNVEENSISLCGESGKVTITELISSINSIISRIAENDCFIFYFSGHGGKESLALSDGLIGLQDLIDAIEKIRCKNKIIILDSCHSGGFSISDTPQIDNECNVNHFAGHGYAVLASCGADEYSGFNNDRRISLYTSFVCDALTSQFLTKKGKKSLEDISESVFHFAGIQNRKKSVNIQNPIFRSNIGGTIFFEVKEYLPYKVHSVYEETDNYIVYKVEPVHTGSAKRLAAKVILRFPSTVEQIADISSEVRDKILHCDVYQNEKSESHHKNKAANIVWCYFGYDEDDMVNSNFICHTTWVDNLQDKNWWYRSSRNTEIVKDVHIDMHPSYEMIKGLQTDVMDKHELMDLTRTCTSKIIAVAEKYIKVFREYKNNTITEEELINAVSTLNSEITILFFKQSDFPIPPKELHEWAHVHTKIACTVHDFSLFYDRKNMDNWTTENRKWLMSDAIKRYESELEELKNMESELQIN